jgi:hypothetical protein
MSEYPKLLYQGQVWRSVAGPDQEKAALADGFAPYGQPPQTEEKRDKPKDRRQRNGPHNAPDAD